ncbi:hypothetical protein KAFR_0D04740 [Kazachstania africana CBS 2517]|uniref:MIF4G domain-containing protein n=1 Tax=Kazachstania africana (strain ATCC 22294 / BCRC 22015 / CBS 2517 / CECT 1963 / NBRC 1671 / NRRL Y-8276) TaxID=1071382 RepID=H2AUS1_KAZAF|nr:hypothetical protein KAFR_0D04740 [Kazachstania africana CBS 2517]CCF58121.1 hypothetical protein KAFR_0D04740 [Kazachstania africana CBS 2517]
MNDERRSELFELNTRAWNGEDVFPLKNKKLDSSIKKNTGFIKKLKKGFTKDSKDSLLKDLSEISLAKYLSELVTTVNEVLSNVPNRNEEVLVAIEVISAMHQRFSTSFTPKLFQLFLGNFENPADSANIEKNEITRLNKLNGNLRIFTELYLVNIFTTLDDVVSKDALPLFLQKGLNKKESLLFSILKEVLNFKFNLGYTTTVGTSFVKRFPFFFDKDDTTWDKFISDETVRPSLQALFKVFTEAVSGKAVELNKKINKLMKEHQKCQIRTGKLVDEYIEEHDTLMPIFERFKSAIEILGEALNMNVPKFKDEKPIEDEAIVPMIINQVLPPNERLWENDETRRFYENLPDIADLVEESMNSTDAAQSTADAINEFFNVLEMTETKESIDELTVSYWRNHLDNKATRNRLLKFFIETQEWSKIRIYSRFVASNSQYLPEVSEELIKYLDNGFRNQLHSNKINVKNIIFFSEMIKFMQVPIFMIFHKIRTLIMNLHVPNNIEILTIFFEHCGKFLLNKPELQPQMEKMVDLLRTKMRDRQLNMSLKSALDNLLTLLFPPSIKSLNLEGRKLTPEEEFYTVLIRSELSNVDYRRAVNLIRKANWKDGNVYNTLFALFTEPEKVNYQNISILSKLLNGLYAYQRNFVIKTIDQVLENIERGLETNVYSENMSRIANVRYLTEIFNMEMIKATVFLDVINNIIRFGCFRNLPNPAYLNESDPPDNYFRVHLVTTILLNVRRFPSTLTKRLGLLTRFFEYYIFTKNQPLPKETEFKVVDTFAKISETITFSRADNIKDCASILEGLVKSLKPVNNSIKNCEAPLQSEEDYEEEEDDEDNDEGQQIDDDYENFEDQKQTTEDGVDFLDDLSDENESDLANDDSSSEEDESDDEDEDEDDDNFNDIDADRNTELKRMYDEYEKRLKSEEEKKAEEELEKQFQQLMLESVEERQNEKASSDRMPIITSNMSGLNKPKLAIARKTNDGASNGSSEKVAFAFLTKSGKKTSSRTLALPTDVKFVSGVLKEEEKLKNEREKIKRIVLQRTFD